MEGDGRALGSDGPRRVEVAQGGKPSAASFLAIIELARGIPGGYELMLYGNDGAEG